ncbi:ROK family protein [Paenibacillus hemerocallicola]|uniref:ROK family protein n=1 Tax=Paenibacillus hemerocallicola TaxID=1172614 RepID=A0A5C4TEE3_9BACL|nr:ROK family protein [Paenibacillus hemerocallicola]TNJ67493.1 ROK family protein [Paenibacillus hemerocallicola]
MTLLGGVDIGGTKCAISIGQARDGNIEVIQKMQFPTPPTPEAAIDRIGETMERLLADERRGETIGAIGISCGGPLNSKSGLILSPPNLPLWDRIDCVTPLRDSFGVPVALQNDANACALAEWKWGAGRGTRNMVFLTFGTGMGAGLILDGRLYTGTNDMAGEVGHIRLAEDGPIGFGKAGSFEGFCSGGGIAGLARTEAEKAIRSGSAPSFCTGLEQLDAITAKSVGEAAERGDDLALHIYRTVGRKLGRGLALLVDLLNPEMIVIGSIYGRQRSILEPIALEELRNEALSISVEACRIVPAGLGEQVGDLAGLSVALNVLEA